jgi:hypothetical protein
MPKKNEYPATGTFTLRQLQTLYQRAQKLLTGCESLKVPQRQNLNLDKLRELPVLDDLLGVEVGTFWAEGFLPGDTRPEVLAGIMRSFAEKLPDTYLEMQGQIAGAAGPRSRGWNSVGCGREGGKPTFVSWLPLLLGHLDAAGREPVLRRVIKAANLPLVVQRKGTWGVEVRSRTNPELRGHPHCGYSDQHGTLSVACWTPSDTPEQQVERIQALLREFKLQPYEYHWRILEVGKPPKPLKTYRTLRALALPGVRFRLRPTCLVTELAGVDSLRRFLQLLPGGKQVQTTLCRFPMPAAAPTKRERLGKIVIRTAKDGHRVSLFLPDADNASRVAIADRLGLKM